MRIPLSKVFNDHMQKLNLTPYQENIVNQINKCQTSALGYHPIKCNNKDCSNEEYIFNCCKSIYCPVCRNYEQLKWSADRMNEVLPVDYSQIVFTIPICLRPLIQFNSKRGLNAISIAVKTALNNTFAKNNNQIGVISVIHTNTQLLNFSPHVHCLIPKGYLNSDKTKWIQITRNMKSFSEKLSVQFKICLLKELKKINKQLSLNTPLPNVFNSVDSILEHAGKCRFKLEVQDYIKDINHTIKYLGDKTKKVIIADKRIVDYKYDSITLSWCDRRNNKIKEQEIDTLLFLKRFMLHILPPRFNRIRYYGFLSNSCKKKSLELCLKLIKKAKIKMTRHNSKVKKHTLELIDKITKPAVCSVCNKGLLIADGL